MANGNKGQSYASDHLFNLYVTEPDEWLFHKISDDQLEMLSMSRRDGLLEALWGFLGIAAGSSIPAAVAAHDSYWVEIENRIPLDFVGLLQIVMCVSAIIAAVVIAVLRHRRGRNSSDLVKEIRERKRVS